MGSARAGALVVRYTPALCPQCGAPHSPTGKHVDGRSCKRNREERDIRAAGFVPIAPGLRSNWTDSGYGYKYPIRSTALYILKLYDLAYFEAPTETQPTNGKPWLCTSVDNALTLEMIYAARRELIYPSVREVARRAVRHMDDLAEFDALRRLGADHNERRRALDVIAGVPCNCPECTKDRGPRPATARERAREAADQLRRAWVKSLPGSSQKPKSPKGSSHAAGVVHPRAPRPAPRRSGLTPAAHHPRRRPAR